MTENNNPTDIQYGIDHMIIPPELDDPNQIQKFADWHLKLNSNIKNDDSGTWLKNERADDDLWQKLTCSANRGYMTLDELKSVAKWKYPGGALQKLVNNNSEAVVKEITKVSFAANSKRLRFGSLLCLQGVGWPMASTILHFTNNLFSADTMDINTGYPILDFRVMRTVRVISPNKKINSYTFQLWWNYVELVRAKAKEFGVSLRTLDRALWTYNYVEKETRAEILAGI